MQTFTHNHQQIGAPASLEYASFSQLQLPNQVVVTDTYS